MPCEVTGALTLSGPEWLVAGGPGEWEQPGLHTGRQQPQQLLEPELSAWPWGAAETSHCPEALKPLATPQSPS